MFALNSIFVFALVGLALSWAGSNARKIEVAQMGCALGAFAHFAVLAMIAMNFFSR